MVSLVRHDLEFMLRQIKIAEAHATGTPLTEIRVDAAGNVTTDPNAPLALSSTLLPYGLRTVDGTYNNLAEGRETWGAADKPFVNLLEPQYRNEGDDALSLGPNPLSNDYDSNTSVVDADPRIISNLIVDQTVDNPAAVRAALIHAGLTGAALNNAIAAVTAAADAGAKRDVLLDLDLGIEVDATTFTVKLPNVAPDEGLSAPYNSWFTLFGQFFDHGLDLVQKGGSGTVYIPLQPDDPLYVPGGHTNFMALTRINQASPDNVTTPFVDQNQTYTSHASHQVFLREYELNEFGRPVATGRLLEGDRGLATWGDVKEQARQMLGIDLTDADVGNVPLLRTDQYGNFIPDPLTGFAQVIIGIGADGIPNTADDDVISGNPSQPASTASAVRTAHAFLDDIAHLAVPVFAAGQLAPDEGGEVGYTGGYNARQQNTSYDNELLDAHYITGDGRGNENIGLSAVHHVFHSEHNHLVDQVKTLALATGDIAFLNEWLVVPLGPNDAFPTTPADIAALQWNGERLFHAARFTNEMEYQHLVFEEFARKVQPDIDAFVFNASLDINPAIFAEFAHVVYRFGHSMLDETVARTNADGSDSSMTLFDAFLNPLAFGSDAVGTEGDPGYVPGVNHEEAAGAIVRGMTAQVGNEIDEFVTHVLRNQLVGIPLDLAALNIARARDAGIPPLNEARRQFQEMANGDTKLDPYTSWVDFALNLKNSASIVNFIAAYGTHDAITGASTVEATREAAANLVFGGSTDPLYADRLDFLNARGEYAGGSLGGLEHVDMWVGGLAEKKMAFGGMLGSTFSFVFELQLENLQNGDRFYYLSRVQGLNLLNELENNSLSKMVLNNTDLGETGYALPGDIFSVPDAVLYMDESMQAKFAAPDPVHDDPVLAGFSDLVERVDADNDGVSEYLRVNSNDHFLIQGTDDGERIIAGGGDDSVWGRGGKDTIEAGYGVDKVHGGSGDDIITNAGTDIGETDFLHGEEGNDVIHAGNGLALAFGNQGNDVIITGPDGKEVFGGTGDDFILGGEGADFLLGNEGDDWIEGGNGFDGIAGDNSELFFDSTIIGHDVMFAGQNEQDFDAESGDDIMVQGESVIRNEGMLGFDWSIYKDVKIAANADLTVPIFTTEQQDILRNRFDKVEALSGWDKDDVLRGDNRSNINPQEGGAENRLEGDELSQAGVDRIDGLRELLGDLIEEAPTGDPEDVVAFEAGNILLGGSGSDILEGRGGDDVIDGDAWLNVRISVRSASDEDVEIRTIDSLAEIQAELLNGTINPGQLRIVREILHTSEAGDIDTAVFSGARSEYTMTQDPTGRVTVSHTGGSGADGTDTLINIERLQFLDGTIVAPVAATGAPDISDMTPAKGQTLTASIGTIADGNGFDAGAVTYQWQRDSGTGFVDIALATGITFTPTTSDLNSVLRVVATFTDGLGFIEQRVSAPTGIVADIFSGTSGADTFLGTGAADLARGFGGNDTLIGQGGNDTLDGGTGADSMVGGGGDDLYYVDNLGDVTVELALGGNDRVVSTVDWTLSSQTERLTLSGTGDLNGTGNGSANRIDGTAGANRLDGAGGNDTIYGGAGNDTLLGQAGNDVLDGGTGADSMVGGDGADMYYVNNIGDVTVELALGGNDRVVSAIDWTLSSEIERLTLSGTGDLNGTGNASANRIDGTAGANQLDGAGGNDTIYGGAGNDTLLGQAGSDVLDGGTGADSMVGGDGGDMYYVNNIGDVTVELALGGNDRVVSTIDWTLSSEIERLTLSGTGDLDGTGNASANRIDGTAGANRLDGGAGNDTIYGGAGNDTLSGGDGRDQLHVGAGADIILFNSAPAATSTDTVHGFTGDDAVHLALSAFDPGGTLGLAVGALGVGSFGSNTSGAATGAGWEVTYETDTGRLWWDADGVGGVARIHVATFADAPTITASDIFIV